MNVSLSQKFLVVYSGVLTAVFAVVMLLGATQSTTHKSRSDEIDVQRINIIEPNGTLRMVISGSARLPGIIYKGKEYPHPNRQQAGLLFFNDEGTENGGLMFDGSKNTEGKVSSHGHLSFDNYEQDQTLAIDTSQDSNTKSANVSIWDRPEYSLSDLLSSLEKNRDATKPEQQAIADRFVNSRPKPQQRLFLGRRDDRSVGLTLKDVQGRERIVIDVATDGTPSLRFLDGDGKVIGQMPLVKQ